MFHRSLNPSKRAKLRSQGGVGAAAWLDVVPTSKVFVIDSPLFLLGIRLRSFMALPLSERMCPGVNCNCELDEFGAHLLACPLTGRKKRRCIPLELAWVQIAAEAGGRARPNVRAGTVGVPGVAPDDGRRLDGVISGLDIFGGQRLVIDATIRAVLTSVGLPAHGADRRDGATFSQARADKARVYPEFHDVDSCKFLTVACETGGRWSDESVALVRALVACRVQRCPVAALRNSVRAMCSRRFWGLLSVAAMKGITQSLEGFADADDFGMFRVVPTTEEMLAGMVDVPEVSRLA